MELQTFINALNSNDIKLARSFQKHVRELEEETKGKFIAFVDDGKDSFVVAIDLGEGQNIIGKQCDCPSTSPFCSHINSVCLAILEINKPKRKPREKKPSKYEEMISNVEAKLILEWLALQMKNDKLLAKKFEIDFMKSEMISAVELNGVHKELLTSLNGRKKTIYATNAGKILKLYNPIHGRILNEQIQNQFGLHNSFDLLVEIRASIVRLNYMLARSSSKRVVTYLNELLEKLKVEIGKLDVISQEKMVKLFYEDKIIFGLGLNWIVTLLISMENISDEVKLEFIKFAFEINPIKIRTRKKYELIFQALKGTKIVEDVIESFPLVLKQDIYNLELIDKLIEVEKYENVISKCLNIITKYSKYSASPFYLRLIKALIQIGDKNKLFEYGIKYFRDFATLEVFYILNAAAPNEEKREGFYKLCKNIRPYNFENPNEAALILMSVYLACNEPEKVFEIMQRHEVWDMPLSIAERLVLEDRMTFISAYLQIGNRFWQLDDLYHENLITILLNSYTVQEVKEFEEKYSHNRNLKEVLDKVIGTMNS